MHLYAKSHKTGTPKYTISVIKLIDKILSHIPARTMSFTSIMPLPKTIAFGGVATGNIKAHEAAKVVPTINKYG